MEVFDILGPVMVGPSSSHTAGVVRIAKITRQLLGGEVRTANISFHGSLAKTYRGHGSDLAVVAGLLGFDSDDERIRDSFIHANECGMNYTFKTINIEGAHPNTLVIEAESKDGKKITVMGESVGGGSVVIKEIDGLEIELTGEYNTIIIKHQDAPGAISLVTSLLSTLRINIASMRVFRTERGGNAIMIIETDEIIKPEHAQTIGSLPYIWEVRIL